MTKPIERTDAPPNSVPTQTAPTVPKPIATGPPAICDAPPPVLVAPSSASCNPTAVAPPKQEVERIPLDLHDMKLLEIIGGSVAGEPSTGLQIFMYWEYIKPYRNSGIHELNRAYRTAMQMAQDAWAEFSRDPNQMGKAITALYWDDENLQKAGVFALARMRSETARRVLREYVLAPSSFTSGQRFAFDHVFKESEWSDPEVERLRRNPLFADEADWIWLRRLPNEEAVREALAWYEKLRATRGKAAGESLREFIRQRGGHIESADPFIVNVDSDNFADRVLGHKGLAVVDVWRSGCPPCQALSARMGQWAAKNTSPHVAFFAWDADLTGTGDWEMASKKYRIRNFPTTLFFIHGQLVDRIVGYHPAELKAKIKKYARQAEQMPQ